jgi:hypothetical protein
VQYLRKRRVYSFQKMDIGWATDRIRKSTMRRLRRRCIHFHFCIEIGDDVLEGGDRLLNSGDLHQFPAAHWTVAVLQRDDQIAPLLLELNKRQTVVRQMSHHGSSSPEIER